MYQVDALPDKTCPTCGQNIAKRKAENGGPVAPSNFKRARYCSRSCVRSAYSLGSKISLEDYFHSLVDRSGGIDACWPFCLTRRYGKTGRGTFTYDGKQQNPSRLALQLSGALVPDHLWVLHSCDNGWCCNPRHLRAGTQAENMADMRSRHRHPNPKGTNSKATALTVVQVDELRKKIRENLYATQAVRRYFKISQATFLKAVYGKGAYAGNEFREPPLPPRALPTGRLPGTKRTSRDTRDFVTFD